jgi:hypothetical protein
MIKINVKHLLTFLITQAILAIIFFSNDNFISGLEAILSVSFGIVLTIYFSWLIKKDQI